MPMQAGYQVILLGGCPLADDLRRTLVARQTPVCGVGRHLRGLRMALVSNPDERFMFVVTLDRATLKRHGKALRRVLADHCSPSSRVRCIGLLADAALTSAAATLGCDLYIADQGNSEQLADLLDCLAYDAQFVETRFESGRLWWMNTGFSSRCDRDAADASGRRD